MMPLAAWHFALASALAIALLTGLGRWIYQGEVWTVVLSLILVTVPIFIAQAHRCSIHRLRRLQGFHQRGWLYRFWSGRLLRYAVWLIYSLVLAYLLLLEFGRFSWMQLSLLVAAVPLFWLTLRGALSLLQRELRVYLVTDHSLWVARLVTTGLLIFTSLLLLWLQGPPVYSTWHDAVSAAEAATTPAPTELVFLGQQAFAALEGSRSYLWGLTEGLGNGQGVFRALLFAVLGQGLVFYGWTLVLSTVCLPRAEWRRVLGPLNDDDVPAALSTERRTMLTAVAVILVFFVTIPGLAKVEFSLSQAPWVQEARQSGSTVELLVRIGDAYYPIDTLQEAEALQRQFEEKAQGYEQAMKAAINTGFDRMADNIDLYLDWYYSLGGEYGRIQAMLLSNLTVYLKQRLTSTLQAGDPFAEWDRLRSEAAQTLDDEAYQAALATLLRARRVEPSTTTPTRVIDHISLADFHNRFQFDDSIDFGMRWGVSAAGAVSGLVASQVAAKALAKGVIQLSAKTVAKGLAAKAASPMLGALTGAGAGTALMPGIGTAIGAVSGLVLGLTIDKGLLELESYWNREAHRAELLAVLEAVRQEMLGDPKVSIQTGEDQPLH